MGIFNVLGLKQPQIKMLIEHQEENIKQVFKENKA